MSHKNLLQHTKLEIESSQMKLHWVMFLNVVILLASMLGSLYLTAWQNFLHHEFSKVGLENYKGTSVETPQIYFAWMLICSSAFSFYVGFQIFKQTEFKILGIFSFLIPAVLFLVGMIMLGSGIHLSRDQLSIWPNLMTIEVFLLVFISSKIVEIRIKEKRALIETEQQKNIKDGRI